MPNFVENPPSRPPAIARVERLPPGGALDLAASPRACVTLVYGGLVRVFVDGDAWFVPDRHGAWIPQGMPHRLQASAAAEVHRIGVDPRRAARAGLPDRPVALRASQILRGVANRLAGIGGPPPTPPEARRLAWVAIDELARLERPDLRLPGGRDPRLVEATRILAADPGDRRGIDAIARAAGASGRTLARLFEAETGMGFRAWRRRLRFLHARERLETGESVGEIAAALGYSSPSAFIAAFGREFGAPPSAFRRR